VRGWVVDTELDVTLGELVDTVLQRAYDDGTVPAREVIVPALPDDAPALQTLLGERRRSAGERGGVVVRVVRRGDKAALAQTVATNAQGALTLYKTRRSGDFTARSQALADLQDALGLASAPLRLECFDVSHLGGTNQVASMVVFEDGLPRKNQYRTFAIPQAKDDTDALYQVLRRRLAHVGRDASGGGGHDAAQDVRAEEAVDPAPVVQETPRQSFQYRPGLLVVDGGQPQVEAAARALRDEGIDDIAVCGIAKRLEEIWLPGNPYPVILPRTSDALFLIQRLRDEAHRFALRYQRTTRSRDIRSQLSSVPGLGPTRIKRLLQHFGSVARLRAASLEDIEQVEGIGAVVAQAIHRELRQGAGV
jgi:excinuclease ABC subunit C